MQRLSLYLLIALGTGFISCSKKNSSGGDSPPTNLTFTATVKPDNSGNVTFIASATNAVTYDFDFGNGVFQTEPSGTVTYRYYESGTYTAKVFAKSAGGQSISKTVQFTVTVVFNLVWSEEFDNPGSPDGSKWGYDLGAGGWGNNELQYYTNRTDNAIVSGGTLKIIARTESYNGSPYTSARLLSKDKFSFKYGRIEARAKLPAGVGTWPAIWMLGNNIGTAGWPACGEIDIMEHLGRDLNKIYATLHHPGHSGANGNGSTVIISNATTEFHKYKLEWTPLSITFSVDDAPFYNFINSASLPFNQNFFIILNIAMGGNFGGPVDPAFTSGIMEIDYLRVYQ